MIHIRRPKIKLLPFLGVCMILASFLIGTYPASVLAQVPSPSLTPDPMLFCEQNDAIYGGCRTQTCKPGSGSSTLTGSDNAQKVWNYFKSKGFSDEQVAAIMGNLAHESGDPTFNKATSSEELSGGGGFGLAQWTGGRRTDIVNTAKSNDKPLTDLSFQLDYLYNEMLTRTERDGGAKTEEQGMKDVKGGSALEDATEYFMYNYERPGVLALQNRIDYAKQYFDKYGGGGGGGGDSSSTSGGDCTCKTGSSGIKKSAPKTGAGESIQEVIDKAVAEAKAKGVDLSVVVSGDVSASGGSGGQMPSASIIKLLIAATLSDKNIPLSSVIADLNPMISISSNDAANRLIDKAGGFGAINATAQKLGVDANIGRRLGTPAGASDPNRMSAQGSDAILTAIKQSAAGGGKINQDYATAIMNAMKAQAINTKWGSSGIPLDKMAHKTGELNGAQHDVGYFFNNDKYLAVSTLTNNPSGGEEPGVSIVRDTAKKIYDAWLGNTASESEPGSSSGCGGGGQECGEGGLIGTLKCYAWPEYSTRTDQMPDYTTAVKRALDEGRYVGGSGGGVRGNDCGGFITTLFYDSGFDPSYNSNAKGGPTGDQMKWAAANWETLGSANSINVADLQPGDVAISATHTYIFVGEVEGFQPTGIASSSIGGPPRAPMAGTENPTSGPFTWFRKK